MTRAERAMMMAVVAVAGISGREAARARFGGRRGALRGCMVADGGWRLREGRWGWLVGCGAGDLVCGQRGGERGCEREATAVAVGRLGVPIGAAGVLAL